MPTQFRSTRLILAAMTFTMALALLESHCSAFAQSPQFEVASVKSSLQRLGPDYNNQIAFLAAGLKARNVTMKRLIAEAYEIQLNQVLGPAWLDQNEYDLEAYAGPASKEPLNLMLQHLLAERFQVKLHRETRQMRVYDLVVAKGGPKIKPISQDDAPASGPGFVFRGTMHRLADLIALQLTFPAISSAGPSQPILAGGPQTPVLDRTALPGVYSFTVNIKPAPGTDGFTAWQRLLQDKVGLKLESGKRDVPVLVIDSATPVPTEN